eukprot:TRINITY_DN12953_c0_g1_i3.p2 TRINITY_DN12953_c0_g1~~TRINITY_DN12953_c0_g1_i3.p2  ORF type:complete len:118 (-),score=14.84 TRINITY_DN12953_c0_g1_i3:451-804(-)
MSVSNYSNGSDLARNCEINSLDTSKRIFNITKHCRQPFNVNAKAVPNGAKSKAGNKAFRAKARTSPHQPTPDSAITHNGSSALPGTNSHDLSQHYRKYCRAYCINIILANQVLSGER